MQVAHRSGLIALSALALTMAVGGGCAGTGGASGGGSASSGGGSASSGGGAASSGGGAASSGGGAASSGGGSASSGGGTASSGGGSASSGGGSASSGGGTGSSDAGEFIRATFMGTPYEVVPAAGSSTLQVQPNGNYPEVVGISGTRITPFLSLSIGNQYVNNGTPGQNYRCTQVTFNNGATFFNARVLADGGNDCTITFTSIATTSGQYYEGTYSANVSQIGGGDGGVYPMTGGEFRAKRP